VSAFIQDARRSKAGTALLRLGEKSLTTETISAGASGNIAYVVLLEKLSQLIQGRSVDVQSIATNVFARTPEAWRLVHRHGSPVLPMVSPDQPPPGQRPMHRPGMPPNFPRQN
jgi:ketosteroid isomerase-like protein